MGIAERRLREFARRESDILGAALVLFDEDDWESVTVEQIAARAEVGKGTVYKHFGSKQEIYARLALDFYTEVLDEVEQVCVDGAADEALREIIVRAFRFHLERPEYRRVVRYCARDDFRRSVSSALRSEFERLDERFLTFMGDILCRGVEQGVFAERPVGALVFCLHAAFDGALAHLWGTSVTVNAVVADDSGVCVYDVYDVCGAGGHGSSRDQLIGEMCEFMLAGIGVPRAVGSSSSLAGG